MYWSYPSCVSGALCKDSSVALTYSFTYTNPLEQRQKSELICVAEIDSSCPFNSNVYFVKSLTFWCQVLAFGHAGLPLSRAWNRFHKWRQSAAALVSSFTHWRQLCDGLYRRTLHLSNVTQEIIIFCHRLLMACCLTGCDLTKGHL